MSNNDHSDPHNNDKTNINTANLNNSDSENITNHPELAQSSASKEAPQQLLDNDDLNNNLKTDTSHAGSNLTDSNEADPNTSELTAAQLNNRHSQSNHITDDAQNGAPRNTKQQSESLTCLTGLTGLTGPDDDKKLDNNAPIITESERLSLANNSKHDSQLAREEANTFGNPHSFLGAFLQTLGAIFKDKGVLLMLIIAPIIYGFFYPWPYTTEVVNQVPVGIIDNDNSNISKTLIRYSAASPQLDTHMFLNEQEAKAAIWKDQIAGYLLIPNGLENKVKSGQVASVSVVGNGGYLLLNKNIQLGFLKAVSTVSAGIEVKKSVAQGAYLPAAKKNTQAIPLTIIPLYNTSEGYGAYVVPGVSILILQQTLLMGAALLIGTLYEQKRHHTSAQGWLGRIFALSLISFIMGCFYYGWVFDLHHYARGANLVGSLVFLAIFFPAVAALGCFLGLWFKERERGLQILIVSSLPLFFISGYPWPVDQLPVVLQYLRLLIPTSLGINTSVQLNQMGASLSQVWPSLAILAGLFVLYYLALLILETSRKHQR